MGAAGLLAVWMICRGLKMKTNNVLIVVAVIVVVGGVAWFRAARQTAKPGTATASDSGRASLAAQKGELCPEPPPAAATAATPTSVATSVPAEPAVAKKMPRVVDLGADKCKACKALAPILAELKKEYAGRVTVEFIDVWKNPKAGEPYKISVIPTQVFFDKDGQEVWRHVGFLPKADFVAKFKELGVK
jgi:thioredoxin 1